MCCGLLELDWKGKEEGDEGFLDAFFSSSAPCPSCAFISSWRFGRKDVDKMGGLEDGTRERFLFCISVVAVNNSGVAPAAMAAFRLAGWSNACAWVDQVCVEQDLILRS